MNRTVYYISDGTGLSAEALGHSLMTQFEPLIFQSLTLPYIDTQEKAYQAVSQINESYNTDLARPIVFSTIVKSEIRQIIHTSQGLVIDFFQSFIGTLEQELKLPSTHTVGLSHTVKNTARYNSRIDAVHFALQCDDGIHYEAYQKANIILLGVSRSGKTPTCLYLALQFGIWAANFPLTEEVLGTRGFPKLPKALEPYRHLLFGLTIHPERLQEIRHKRRPNSPYASLKQCQEEIQQAESLYHRAHIPYLDSTYLSIEELSTHILRMMGLKRSI